MNDSNGQGNMNKVPNPINERLGQVELWKPPEKPPEITPIEIHKSEFVLPGKKVPKLRRMSNIEEKETNFLWYPFLPWGALSYFQGDPDVGKTWLLCEIAARLSRGEPLPCMFPKMQEQLKKPVVTLFVTCEDSPEKTIKKRLRLCGADDRYIIIYNGEDDGSLVSFLEPELINAMIEATGARFVCVDPLQGFVGDTDINKTTECRKVGTKIHHIAEKHDVCIANLRHCRKGAAGENLMYRGSGNIDINAQGRSAMHVAMHPDEEKTRVILQFKSNLSEKGFAATYKLEKDKFSWGEFENITAEDLDSKKTAKAAPKRVDAETWLIGELAAAGPGGLPVPHLKAKAKDAGHNWNTVEDAAEILNVQKRKDGFQGPGVWSYLKKL